MKRKGPNLDRGPCERLHAFKRSIFGKVWGFRETWWTWPGSNRRPLPCHGSALPTAPQAHLLKGKAAQASLDWSNSRLPVGDSQTLSRKLHLLGDRLCEIVENGYPVDGQATKS